MHTVFENVNDAFYGLVRMIDQGQVPIRVTTSRVGEVLQVTTPMIVTYLKPRERVLFNIQRDANPFFHLFESIWMLAGRNDVIPVAYYSSKIAEIASDDGSVFNGAYGYRWRHHFQVDQIEELIEHLQRVPNTRRAILAMWDGSEDCLSWENTLDIPCNTHACFMINGNDKLDMTVFNRSNDLVLGMLGANVVHFSYLQEYIAGRIGKEVGVYNQVTNNLHVYKNNWKPEKWLEEVDQRTMHSQEQTSYGQEAISPHREYIQASLVELKSFTNMNCPLDNNQVPPYYVGESSWKDPVLRNVVQPMCNAFHAHKRRDYKYAQEIMAQVYSNDWKESASAWLTRREQSWLSRREKERAKTSPNQE